VTWTDLDRPPLSAIRLQRDLVEDGFDLRVVARTASTNADLVAAAATGAAEGTVLVAESQEAGRGRLGRTWTSPPRAGLTVSVLLRPAAADGWLPLLTGFALALALRDHAGLDATVKWPNDVVVAGPDGVERKLAGILAEVAADGAVVIGVGVNVTTRADEFAGVVPGSSEPTSLALAGARVTDRETVLKTFLRSLSRAYASWRSDPASIAPLYRQVSATLGRQVRIELPDGTGVTGTARDVDAAGRLVVEAGDGTRTAYAAGDVVHLQVAARDAGEGLP
jgi:BirA family biotin operon repressor/biotin-[acetyl-CoA-carboxylase] ligase